MSQDMVAIPNTPTLVAEENMENQPPQQSRNVIMAPVPIRHHHNNIPNPERSNKEKSGKDRLPTSGETFKNDKNYEYVLRQKLGDGAMGHVFLSHHGKLTVAIKTEKYTTAMLPMEIKVLVAAKRHNAKHVCDIFDYGTVRKEYNYMVISLLGKDLYRLRSEQPTKSFSLNTTTRIALETLEAIRELHNIGYLSRDVKPSNFAPGLRESSQHKTIYMFDFGLAKKYLDRDGRKLKSRGEVGWRGTVRYGSLMAHKRMDLGRRDDLECWFYMLVEMHNGELPWRFVTDRTAVGNAKLFVRNEGRDTFFFRLPKQFEKIMKLIDGLAFEVRPDYDMCKELIMQIRTDNKLPDRIVWDWQTEESTHSEITEVTSVLSDNGILAEPGATNFTDRLQGMNN